MPGLGSGSVVAARVPRESRVTRWLHRRFFATLGSLPSSVRLALSQRVFDRVHARSSDPWCVRSDEFEVFKRECLAWAVPPRAVRVVEVGCSVGENLSFLGSFLPESEVWGCDVSLEALASARVAVYDSRRKGGVFLCPPAGPVPVSLKGSVDVVLFSEVLYYASSPRAMREAFSWVRDVLAPVSTVVMVHTSSDAGQLHARAACVLGLEVVESSWVTHSVSSRRFLVTRAESSRARSAEPAVAAPVAGS